MGPVDRANAKAAEGGTGQINLGRTTAERKARRAIQTLQARALRRLLTLFNQTH